MATSAVTTLADSLDRLDVGWTRTAADTVESTLDSLTRGPTIGVALPEGLSLPASVTQNPTPEELRAATTGITSASLAVADYGSLVLEATPEGAEQVSLFPDLHVAVLDADDIVPDMATAFERLGPQFRETGGSAILATGPSATADMGELVRGAHGPKEVHVVIVDDEVDDE